MAAPANDHDACYRQEIPDTEKHLPPAEELSSSAHGEGCNSYRHLLKPASRLDSGPNRVRGDMGNTPPAPRNRPRDPRYRILLSRHGHCQRGDIATYLAAEPCKRLHETDPGVASKLRPLASLNSILRRSPISRMLFCRS